MAYAARFPGLPGYGAVCMDDPRQAKDTAKLVANWIRRGAQIERVSAAEARAGLAQYLEAKMRKP